MPAPIVVAFAFAAALGLLGMAIALWLFIDGLQTRRRRRLPPDANRD